MNKLFNSVEELQKQINAYLASHELNKISLLYKNIPDYLLSDSLVLVNSGLSEFISKYKLRTKEHREAVICLNKLLVKIVERNNKYYTRRNTISDKALKEAANQLKLTSNTKKSLRKYGIDIIPYEDIIRCKKENNNIRKETDRLRKQNAA